MRQFTPQKIASTAKRYTSPPPKSSEPSRPPRHERDSSNSYSRSGPVIQLDFNPLELLDCLHRWKCRETRLRDQQFDRFLAMIRGFEGVITLPDVMLLFDMDRSQAQRLLAPYLRDGYCHLLDENHGEPLYFFPRLAPPTVSCGYCGSVFQARGRQHTCCSNCGAQL